MIYGEPKLPDAPCSDQIADARIIISIGMSALARIKMHVIANFACFFFHRPRVFAVGGFPCEGHSPNGKAHSESVVCDRRSRYQWLRQQQVLLGCVLGVLLISIEWKSISQSVSNCKLLLYKMSWHHCGLLKESGQDKATVLTPVLAAPPVPKQERTNHWGVFIVCCL